MKCSNSATVDDDNVSRLDLCVYALACLLARCISIEVIIPHHQITRAYAAHHVPDVSVCMCAGARQLARVCIRRILM